MSIDTNDLIGMLSRAPRPQPLPLSLISFAMVLAGWVLTYVILGLRPDIAQIPLPFLQKTAALALAVLLACLAFQRAAKPLAPDNPKSALFVVTVAFAVWFGWEWMNVEVRDIMAVFLQPYLPFCLAFTSAYGLAAMAGLVYAARHHAPADGEKAATTIGLCASFIAGLGYSIHCPIDSPTFILVAYGLPTLTLTLIAHKILPRFLRW